MAAIDFHVAQELTEHLARQPAVQAAVQTLRSSNPAIAAQYSAYASVEELVNSTIWLFRSSLNRKTYLQECYCWPGEQEKVQRAGGYAQQVRQQHAMLQGMMLDVIMCQLVVSLVFIHKNRHMCVARNARLCVTVLWCQVAGSSGP